MKKDFVVFLFYICLTFLFTYPAILRPSQVIYGVPEFHTDPLGVLWETWWHGYAHKEKISPYPIYSTINYPWGYDKSDVPPLPVFDYPRLFLAQFFNEGVVYNIMIWFGLFGTAVAMYYLMYYFTKNRFVSLIAGVMFSFSQDHLMHSMQHPAFTLLLWVPLYIFSLFKLFEKPSYKSAFSCSLVYFLLLFCNYYYAYFMVIATLLFLLCRFFKYKLTSVEIKFLFVTLIFVFILSYHFIFPVINRILDPQDQGLGLVSKQPFQDLIKYSARWQDYLLPSEYHPLWGKWTEAYVGEKLGGRHYFERTLYIGFISLIFSFLAIVKRKKIITSQPKIYLVFLFFPSLAIISFIFSLSPVLDLGRFKIPMPSFFAYKLLPMFRVYSRLGILVILSVTILAGMGINYILNRINHIKWRRLAGGGILSFVLLELINIPPFHYIDLTNIPLPYKWLAEQPGDISVVEYPWERGAEQTSIDYQFYQRIHKKKLVNCGIEGSLGDAFRKECYYPSRRETTELFAYLGVDYMILHKNSYSDDYLVQIDKNPGLKLIMEFPDEKVYKIISDPSDLPVVFWQNVASPEKWDDGNYWRWIGNNATVWTGPVKDTVADLEFNILAFAKDRELKIYLNNLLLKKIYVIAPKSPELSTKVYLGNVLLQKGDNIIRFYTPQGETMIGDIAGNSDTRRVSFAINDFKIIPQ